MLQYYYLTIWLFSSEDNLLTNDYSIREIKGSYYYHTVSERIKQFLKIRKSSGKWIGHCISLVFESNVIIWISSGQRLCFVSSFFTLLSTDWLNSKETHNISNQHSSAVAFQRQTIVSSFSYVKPFLPHLLTEDIVTKTTTTAQLGQESERKKRERDEEKTTKLCHTDSFTSFIHFYIPHQIECIFTYSHVVHVNRNGKNCHHRYNGFCL